MTARHAFQRRDGYTCSECFYLYLDKDGVPHCKRHMDTICYDPHQYGCGNYGSTDSGEQEVPNTVYMFGTHGKKTKVEE